MADVLEPVMNSHRLVVDTEVIKLDNREPVLQRQLFYQMSRLTRDRGALRHDDRLDALSMAVEYWVEAMARDTDVAAQDARQEALDDELENFMNHVLGRGEEHKIDGFQKAWNMGGFNYPTPSESYASRRALEA
jgi:hypothetical protein